MEKIILDHSKQSQKVRYWPTPWAISPPGLLIISGLLQGLGIWLAATQILSDTVFDINIYDTSLVWDYSLFAVPIGAICVVPGLLYLAFPLLTKRKMHNVLAYCHVALIWGALLMLYFGAVGWVDLASLPRRYYQQTDYYGPGLDGIVESIALASALLILGLFSINAVWTIFRGKRVTRNPLENAAN